METAVANLTAPRHARRGHRQRLLRRSARADARALRRGRDARRGRVGPRVSIPRGSSAALDARRRSGRRWCTPRRRPACSTRWRSCARSRRRRRDDDRRHGDVARRASGRRRRVGRRRRLQLHAEGTRRAVGPGADRVLARARENAAVRRKIRVVLLRSEAAEDYWVDRKYHHTISAPLVYALREALAAIEEEGLEARWERHRANHLALRGRARRDRSGAAAAAGGAAVVAERGQGAGRASTRRACAGSCSRITASRSAPASVRSPARSGASD